jgi:2-dehydro-3-deoxygluconokinase
MIRGEKMADKIILAGEPMGLFIAKSKGALEDVSEYSCAVAGAEFNVAVGLRRLGHRAGYCTKLGDDPFGRRIKKTMERNGIGTELLSWSKERSTGFMLKSMTAAGDPDIFYFRKNSAASTLCRDDIDRLDLTDYRWLHLTGIFPALSDSTREASFRLIERARENGMAVSFDPNLRPQLWGSKEKMVETINALAAKSDYIFPGAAEGRILTGSDNPEEIAAFYRRLGVKAVAVKVGKKGAYASQGSERFLVRGCPVKQVVDTVGAGDGFAAGIISALTEGLSLREAVRRGNAVGAVQITFRGDNEGLPTPEQLSEFLKESDKMFERGEGV